MAILVGCAGTDLKRLNATAEAKGKVQARIDLPPYPAGCGETMGRVYPKLTEKPRNTQLRWEFAADTQDAINARCAQFYRDVQTRYAGPR
jgi:hypothetical protein